MLFLYAEDIMKNSTSTHLITVGITCGFALLEYSKILENQSKEAMTFHAVFEFLNFPTFFSVHHLDRLLVQDQPLIQELKNLNTSKLFAYQNVGYIAKG